MKTDREKAMEWWNSFNGKLKQVNLIIKHLPNRPKSLKLDNITGREIEIIWRKEKKTKQKPNDILGSEAFADKASLTITVKRPIIYTEEDVLLYLHNLLAAIRFNDDHSLLFINKWFEENKKK